MDAIFFNQISKKYGCFTAIQCVTLKIQVGEFFGLLGPNGAGKTTLISILAGLSKQSTGSVHLMGLDIRENACDTKRLIGVVPQELVFDPFFTVRETLQFQSGYFGIKKNESWIEEIISNLGLINEIDKNMRMLSGGMKRRVLIAQALVHKPPVIVLDEPTAGVDIDLRQSLWEFLITLNKNGHTIVLTTHYLEEAQQLCNRIAMMKFGKIVALDTTENFLKKTNQDDKKDLEDVFIQVMANSK